MLFEVFLRQIDQEYVVRVQTATMADLTPPWTKIGNFEFEVSFKGDSSSTVIYHHVRDLLYPLEIWDMQRVSIDLDMILA